jgi:hypothetical protein
MKKDIPQLKVQDIAIAAIPSDEELWDIYLINLKAQNIYNVIITSRGYGERNGEKVKTSQLRYFFEHVGPEMAVKVEPVQTALFDLSNEYWISFQFEGQLYDKKYVFVPGALQAELFTLVPIVEKQGVMIR